MNKTATTNTYIAGHIQGRHYNTLAAQLKKLGFRKQFSWSSNYYTRDIVTSLPGWGINDLLTVKLDLRNYAWTGHNWYIENIRLDGRMGITGSNNELITLIAQLEPLMEMEIRE